MSQPSVPSSVESNAPIEPLFVDRCCADPDTVVVTPKGEADLCTVPRLRQALLDVIGTGPPHVIVDLDHLRFMDASTLGVLAEARQRSFATGADLQVRCHTRLGSVLLSTAGLDDMLEHDSEPYRSSIRERAVATRPRG